MKDIEYLIDSLNKSLHLSSNTSNVNSQDLYQAIQILGTLQDLKTLI